MPRLSVSLIQIGLSSRQRHIAADTSLDHVRADIRPHRPFTFSLIGCVRAVPLIALIALIALLCGSCQTLQQRPNTVLSMTDLMERIIDSAADVFWSSSGTTITADGEKSRAPTDAQGWTAAENAAATLVEMGNVLLSPERAQGREEWSGYAVQLSGAAAAGLRAAQARDERAVFDTGGEIYQACRSCHIRYAPAFQSSGSR